MEYNIKRRLNKKLRRLYFFLNKISFSEKKCFRSKNENYLLTKGKIIFQRLKFAFLGSIGHPHSLFFHSPSPSPPLRLLHYAIIPNPVVWRKEKEIRNYILSALNSTRMFLISFLLLTFLS